MMKNAISLSLVLALCSSTSAQAAPSARELMQKNEQSRTLQDSKARAKLTQLTAGKGPKEKEFRWMRKQASNGKDFRTFVRFLAPATVKNEGLLIQEHEGGENDVQLYLPAYKKVRRVENQQQSGKFMGSEFSYSDLATPHLSDFDYSGGELVPCPGADSSGKKCHRIESKPANAKVAERTGYSRIINLIRQDHFMLVQAEYFGADGKPLKKLEAEKTEPAEGSPGKWITKKTRMTHIPSGNQSVIELFDVQVNSGLPDSQFTVQNLSRTD